MSNPFKTFTKKERLLWYFSLIMVALSNIFAKDVSLLTVFAAMMGVTAVLLCAKGNVWGQILISLFCLFYAYISYQFHYWGEMITYMGMALPMALWSIYTWVTHPSNENEDEVEINYLSVKVKVIVVVSSVIVTYVFYRILLYFNTPNMFFSTISITTSFLAAATMMLRSSYYAFWYASNDFILVILWVLASLEDPSYIPIVVNFAVFFINDVYGFISWKKREKVQK